MKSGAKKYNVLRKYANLAVLAIFSKEKNDSGPTNSTQKWQSLPFAKTAWLL